VDKSKQTQENETKPKENEFGDSKNQALQMLSSSEFDIETKKEYGQKIKATKNLEELGKTMNGFLNYLAKKLNKKKEENPREESKKITQGKLPEKHLGRHTIETTGQEIFSLGNIRPMFRDEKWTERCSLMRKVCMREISKGDPHFQNLLIQLSAIEAMR